MLSVRLGGGGAAGGWRMTMEKVFSGRDFRGKIVVNLHLLIVLYLSLGMAGAWVQYFIAAMAISAVHLAHGLLGSAPLAFFLNISAARHRARST